MTALAELEVRAVVEQAKAGLTGLKDGLKSVRTESKTTSESVTQDQRKTSEQINAGAESAVKAGVKQRDELTRQAAAYREIAAAAKKGSDEQITAARLATEANNKLTGSQERGTRAAEEHGAAMKEFGKSVAIYAAAFIGAGGIEEVLKGGIDESMNLQKQLERTNVTFGDSAKEVKEWAENGAHNMGLWQGAALDAANTVGTLLKNVGIAPEKLTEMSKGVVQLSADMAAFKGVDPSTALSALESALQGRTRTLKTFGIVIDAASISEEAYADGIATTTVNTLKVKEANQTALIAQQHLTDAITKHGAQSVEAAAATVTLEKAQAAVTKATAGGTGALSDQQKALATYKLIMRQTADQQGDFAKHSGDLAQQQQVLRADIKNVEEELGSAFIPQLEKILPIIDGWITRNQKNGNMQRWFNDVARDTATVVKSVVQIVEIAKDAFDKLSDAVGGDKHAIELLIGAYVTLKATAKAAALVEVVQGLTGIGAAAGEAGAAGEVGGLLTKLNLLKVMGPIVIAIAVEETFKKLTGVDAFSLGDATASDSEINDVGNPYGKGTSNAMLYAAGKAGKAPPNGMSAMDPAYLAGVNANKGSGNLFGTLAGERNASSAGNIAAGQPAIAAAVAAAPDARTASIIQTAGSRLGQAYSYGGTSWDLAMDCSGFVQNVMAKNGITVPRTSQAQAQGGMAVGAPTTANLIAGDLVFTEGWPHPGHVGIYIGNGQVIEDPHTGDSVKVEALSSFNPSGARRYYKTASAPAGGGTPPAGGGASSGGGGGGGGSQPFVEAPPPKPVKIPKLSASGAISLQHTASDVADSIGQLMPGAQKTALKKQAEDLLDSIHAGMTGTAAAKVRADLADLRKEISDGVSLKKAIAKTDTEVGELKGKIGKIADPTMRAQLTGQATLLGVAFKDGLLSKAGAATAFATLKAQIAAGIKLTKEKAEAETEVADLNTRIAKIANPTLRAQVVGQAALLIAAVKDGLVGPKSQAMKTDLSHLTDSIADDLKLQTGVASARTAVGKIQKELLTWPAATKGPLATEAAQISAEIGKVVTTADLNKVKTNLTHLTTQIKTAMTAAKNEVTAAKQVFSTAWGQFASDADKAFQRVTSDTIASQKITVQMADGTSFQYGQGDDTPAGQALAALQAKAAQDQRDTATATAATGLTTAQQALTTITGLGVGKTGADGSVITQADIDAAKQAVTDAQAQVAAASLDQQESDLQIQADAQQKAADSQFQTWQNSYQDQRDAAQTALDGQLSDLETALSTQKITWSTAMGDISTILSLGGADAATAFWTAYNSAQALVTASGGTSTLTGAQGALGGVTSAEGTVTAQGGTPVPGVSSGSAAGGGSSSVGGGGTTSVGGTGTYKHKPLPLADGGIATSPTLAMIGEKPGSIGEMAFRIDDPRALAMLTRAFQGAGGGGPNVTVVVPGATILGRDRQAAREFANIVAPQIGRQIGYKTPT